jgi:hypothetical protein
MEDSMAPRCYEPELSRLISASGNPASAIARCVALMSYHARRSEMIRAWSSKIA